MEAVFPVLLVVAVVTFIIVCRLIAGSFDRDRIHDYITSKGGQVISIDWSPFGRGWFGSKNERIYEVVYIDAAGRRHQATCKTSMMAGVYFTEDDALMDGPARQSPEDARMKYERWRRLEDENRRLREEVERLKQERRE